MRSWLVPVGDEYDRNHVERGEEPGHADEGERVVQKHGESVEREHEKRREPPENRDGLAGGSSKVEGVAVRAPCGRRPCEQKEGREEEQNSDAHDVRTWD